MRNGKPFRYRGKTLKKAAIVGSPNVGKSVLFNALSKQYVAVSNYPGTTVEVSRGTLKLGDTELTIIDTPGMYSLSPITEEERVARKILITERPDLVIHVVDAKNLERMLPLTLQLIEASLPTVLVLNIMDEAEKEGIRIDIKQLSAELGIPVVATVSTSGRGIPDLKDIIQEFVLRKPVVEKSRLSYSDRIEKALDDITGAASAGMDSANLSERSLALLLLKEDREIEQIVKSAEPAGFEKVRRIINDLKTDLPEPVDYRLAISQKREANRIVSLTVTEETAVSGFKETLSRLMMHPIAGSVILLFVLYWGLYKFVGEFGAGTVVDFLEGKVFEERINPVLIDVFTRIIPWQSIQDLLVGEYGLLTLGVRYAVALILPLITFFFLVFSVIEDTGYLPRLAMLIDRTFKKIGLSGRAVIPMVLGLGCDTMATMVTRTLPTKRERLIATMLLALAVPCSAQLGVILALLEGHRLALLIWVGVICMVFLFVGYLGTLVLPGRKASFYIEVPPLRLPKISNILTKTYVRVVWYFKEVLPLFLLASVLIWLGQLSGLFDLCLRLLIKPVRLIGLPDEAATIFLFGFFRRDYGAAGLYDLNKAGLLDGRQLVVASIALTLFLPCIAQFLMNIKERGWKTGIGISIFILLFSFATAFVVNFVLTFSGITL